jgi:hypothetical protein
MQFEIISIESMTDREIEIFEHVAGMPRLVNRRCLLQTAILAAAGLTAYSAGVTRATADGYGLVKCSFQALEIANKAVPVGQLVLAALEYFNPRPSPIDGPIVAKVTDNDGTLIHQGSARVSLNPGQKATMRLRSPVGEEAGDREMSCKAYDDEISDDFSAVET